MTKEIRAKTFKSGNSVALRLPKALGIKEGVEMKVREEQGRYVVEPVEAPKKKINLSFLEGRTAGLKPLRPEEREIEERDLDWTGKLLKRD
jgi:antitoxin VapB